MRTVEIPNNISQRFDDGLLVRRVESGDLPELLALLPQLHEEEMPPLVALRSSAWSRRPSHIENPKKGRPLAEGSRDHQEAH